MNVKSNDVEVHTSTHTDPRDGKDRHIVSISWTEEDYNTTVPRVHQKTIPYDVLVATVFSEAFKRVSDQY